MIKMVEKFSCSNLKFKIYNLLFFLLTKNTTNIIHKADIIFIGVISSLPNETAISVAKNG
jgi:hypothetical protein